MKKENAKQIRRIVTLLFTFSLFIFPFGASAGVIRKPPNNLGLVVYWPMDEGSGTILTDHSGNRKNGTLSATNQPTWSNGKLGKSLYFNGSATGNQVTFSGINTTTTHTVSFWIKISADCTNWGSLFSTDGGNGLYCLKSGGNKISYYYSGDHLSNTDLQLNRWYHIALVNNAGSATFYLDGVTNGTASAAPAYTATNMGNDAFNDTFNGYIDDLRVYNRALSATDILGLYKSGSAKVGLTDLSPGTLKTGLTGHWTFDGKDMVQNVADVSGNGRHGYLTSSTTTVPGKIGQAIYFAGTNGKEVSTVASNNLITATDGTISAWVRPTGASSSCTTSGIYSCRFAVSNPAVLAVSGIAWGNNTTLGQDKIWAVNSTGIATHQVVGTDYTKDEWAHIAWMHSGGALSIYKNGEFIASTTAGNTYDITQKFLIGRAWTGTGNNMKGDVDDVRTWNRALSASEIKQVYNIGAGQKVSKASTPVGTLKDGLQGHWTFDGGDTDWNTNTVTDKSGNGNTGTMINIATSTGAVIGKAGQALTFNGTNGYIDLGDKAVWEPNGSTSFSVSFWYKGLKGSLENFLTHSPAIGTSYWHISDTSAFFCGSSSCGTSKDNTYTLPNDNDWHHLAVSLNASTNPDQLNVYLDGVSIGTQSGDRNGGGSSWGTNTFIGRPNWAGNGYRKGTMDEVRIYNRALSATEAKQLYNLGR